MKWREEKWVDGEPRLTSSQKGGAKEEEEEEFFSFHLVHLIKEQFQGEEKKLIKHV